MACPYTGEFLLCWCKRMKSPNECALYFKKFVVFRIQSTFSWWFYFKYYTYLNGKLRHEMELISELNSRRELLFSVFGFCLQTKHLLDDSILLLWVCDNTMLLWSSKPAECLHCWCSGSWTCSAPGLLAGSLFVHLCVASTLAGCFQEHVWFTVVQLVSLMSKTWYVAAPMTSHKIDRWPKLHFVTSFVIVLWKLSFFAAVLSKLTALLAKRLMYAFGIGCSLYRISNWPSVQQCCDYYGEVLYM